MVVQICKLVNLALYYRVCYKNRNNRLAVLLLMLQIHKSTHTSSKNYFKDVTFQFQDCIFRNKH